MEDQWHLVFEQVQVMRPVAKPKLHAEVMDGCWQPLGSSILIQQGQGGGCCKADRQGMDGPLHSRHCCDQCRGGCSWQQVWDKAAEASKQLDGLG